MKPWAFLIPAVILFPASVSWAVAEPEAASISTVPKTNTLTLDLPTTLRLAGAQALDISIARQKLAEARANEDIAVWQFFPVIVPGVGYRRHDNLIQDVSGHVIDVHKDSYTIGPTVSAQWDLGEAIYQRLAARQRTRASEFAVDGQSELILLSASRAFFSVAKAQGAVHVQSEAVRLAGDLARQIRGAVASGIAFKGDSLRADVQAERSQIALRQAHEQLAVATADLANTLHLDSSADLAVSSDELLPLTWVNPEAPLATLVAQAWANRPEIKQSSATVAAAQDVRKGARYGPLVPTVGAQVFLGGLGGGIAGEPGRFGESEDYQFTLGWRIGPGGLLDQGRLHAADARQRQAELEKEKLFDEIRRDVVTSQARLRSLSDQLSLARHTVQLARDGFELSIQRKEFAVGVVLEQVQAEQDLTRARIDYLNTVADYNQAQLESRRAVGGMVESAASASASMRNP